MAGSISDYGENKLLDHLLGTTSYTFPSQTYVGLYTVAPTDAGGGTEVSTSGTAYVRQAIDFSAASGGATANSALVTFPAATGSGYGTVVAFGLFDASSGGNLLGWADLAANKTIGAGDVFDFPIGEVDVTLA